MQFDIQEELFQCSAVPFGWNDAPRVFCKFVCAMVGAVRSPAGRAGENASRHSKMRVLPYMDDFVVLVDSFKDGLQQRDRVQCVLHRLGLQRNEKKGHMVRPGVVVPTTGDEQVERPQDLETTDESKGAHRLIQDGVGRLWSLLDSHDIELQARYIHSEANVWADGLSRCEDLDDWRLNRDWFEWADKQWGPYTVDRFASEISAQLPRYYAAWRDPRCEGVDSLTYDWRGENNWVNPPWALLDELAHKLRLEVFWVDDDKFYPEVVKGFNEDGTVHVVYDDGDEKSLNLSEEKFNIKRSADVAEQNDEAAEVVSEKTWIAEATTWRTSAAVTRRSSSCVYSVDDGEMSWLSHSLLTSRFECSDGRCWTRH
ncbi:hypothetical protein CYMTET_7327 [Cymbomonas tetramitiformis]|uniref:Reverse transcriptase domain-containing protein n=1 Tax=Cymbomonas tetramitiformis TaxID=36881 RepID=A0AAE0GVG1_9CHLO|nr:hypothetical protein CYMTET_7327 [Cymbomonas tetramitiformis]